MNYDKQILEQLLSEKSRIDYKKSVSTSSNINNNIVNNDNKPDPVVFTAVRDARNKFKADLNKQHTNMLNTLGTPNAKPTVNPTPNNASSASSVQINKMEKDMAHTGTTQSSVATTTPLKPIEIKQPDVKQPEPINVSTNQYKKSVLYINKDNKPTLPPKQDHYAWEKPQTSTQNNTQTSTQATAQAKKSGNVIDHMKQLVKDHPKATTAVGAGSAALASAYAVYRMLKKKKAQALQRNADVEQLNKELARARARLNRLKQQQS